MNIDSDTRSLQECMTMFLYEIPSFQRPYCWEDDQLEDFWVDAIEKESDDDLFLGSIVTWVSEIRETFKNTHQVIDGQQRLTTTTILLAVLRDQLGKLAGELNDEHYEDEQEARNRDKAVKKLRLKAKKIRELINTEDNDLDEYPVLKRNDSYFWAYIQNEQGVPGVVKSSLSESRTKAAYDFFAGKVENRLGKDTSISVRSERVSEIRDALLSCKVVQISVDSEEDAFLIFETLNTRGQELNVADLVKNMLVRGVSSNPRDRQNVEDRWNAMALSMAESDDPDDFNSFIWQSWNSRREAVKVPELYKSATCLIDDGKLQYMEYLKELESDLVVFNHLFDDTQPFPSVKKQDNKGRPALTIPEVQDTIRALSLFNVSVANSAVMSLLRKYDDTNILTQKNLKRALWAIEVFHFQFTAIAGSGSTGGTRGRYNRFAVELHSASTKQEVSLVIDDLEKRLSNALPSRETLKGRFGRLFYAPDRRISSSERKYGSRDLIEYVLATMAFNDKKVNRRIPEVRWSIEHIFPQSKATSENLKSVENLGNLVLTTSAFNSEELKDLDFLEKAPKLASHAFPLDSVLQKAFSTNVWGVDGISSRLEVLEARAFDEVWTI